MGRLWPAADVCLFEVNDLVDLVFEGVGRAANKRCYSVRHRAVCPRVFIPLWEHQIPVYYATLFTTGVLWYLRREPFGSVRWRGAVS